MIFFFEVNFTGSVIRDFLILDTFPAWKGGSDTFKLKQIHFNDYHEHYIYKFFVN